MTFLKYLFCVAIGTIVGIIVLFLDLVISLWSGYGKGGFNMPRYIDADSAKAIYLSKSAGEQLDRVPTADVQEVKHGEWEYKRLDNFRKYMVVCPFCKREYADNYDGYIDADDFNYCPNCGAKMDGKE